MSIYDCSAKTIEGADKSFEDYRGKVLLIVNVASKWGFTGQYKGLEGLYEKYKEQGFEILGFPCNQFGAQEPGSNEEVKSFCTGNYGVTFQMFEKTDVRGGTAHPLYKELEKQQPFKGFEGLKGKAIESLLKSRSPEFWEDDGVKWNFTKFLVDREGNAVARFEPNVGPEKLGAQIEKYL